jgi:hypothetical protein
MAKHMNPQGQRPGDVGEDLPDSTGKASESDEDRGKKDPGKKDADKKDAGKKATAFHKPGKM